MVVVIGLNPEPLPGPGPGGLRSGGESTQKFFCFKNPFSQFLFFVLLREQCVSRRSIMGDILSKFRR